MTGWQCARCRAQWAPGAPCCPQCRSTKRKADEVTLKINSQGVVSDSAAVPQVHHGYHHGQRGTVATANPDGTQSGEAANDAVPGTPEPAQVTQLPPGQPAAPEPVPHVAPHPPEGAQLPPVRPPSRRPPRAVPGGE